MIALSKYKQILGEDAKGMSDDEIRQLRDAQYRFARLAFDKWQMERMEVQPLIDNTL